MPGFYILSTPAQAQKNEFKIGFHTGTTNKLISRYRTGMPHVQIYFFARVECGNSVENRLKAQFDSQRMLTAEGRKSEWFNVPLLELIVAASQAIVDLTPITSSPDPAVNPVINPTDNSSESEAESSSDLEESSGDGELDLTLAATSSPNVSPAIASSTPPSFLSSILPSFLTRSSQPAVQVPIRAPLAKNKTDIGTGEWWKAVIRNSDSLESRVSVRGLKEKPENEAEESEAKFVLRVSGCTSNQDSTSNYTKRLNDAGLIKKTGHGELQLQRLTLTDAEESQPIVRILQKLGLPFEFEKSLQIDYFFEEPKGWILTVDDQPLQRFSAARIE